MKVEGKNKTHLKYDKPIIKKNYSKASTDVNYNNLYLNKILVSIYYKQQEVEELKKNIFL